MPTIDYTDLSDLQDIVEQFNAFQGKQQQAKRLSGNAIKMLRDAEALFTELATQSQPGGTLEKAEALTGGWLAVPLPMSDQPRTIAEAIGAMVAKLDELHAFMADMEAAYSTATGGSKFFTDLPTYGG